MKKETVKRFLNSKPLSTIYFSIIIVLLCLTIITGINMAFGGVDKIYSGYPNAEYEKLEEEVENIIVINENDQYIDMERLSDKDIEYTYSFIKSNTFPEKTWEIELRKGDIDLDVMAKLEGNTIEVLKFRDTSKNNFYFIRTMEIVGIIIICIIILLLISSILLPIFIFLQDKRSNSVSKEKNS